MILSLKNIGKVESAKVELNGITVIAGENDTGKSTIGKALYSIFNGFYKIESSIIAQIITTNKLHIDTLAFFFYYCLVRFPESKKCQ